MIRPVQVLFSFNKYGIFGFCIYIFFVLPLCVKGYEEIAKMGGNNLCCFQYLISEMMIRFRC